ncbi:hypothetical protein C8Q80DRAFT_271325 [Daedaleopsis nitida]|nr:hypothetical protein C8Q80DRAFT_271325 [Daedaleopsis nitida]
MAVLGYLWQQFWQRTCQASPADLKIKARSVMTNPPVSTYPDGRARLVFDVKSSHAKQQQQSKTRTERSGPHIHAVALLDNESLRLTLCRGKGLLIAHVVFDVHDISHYPVGHAFANGEHDYPLPCAEISDALNEISKSGNVTVRELLSKLRSHICQAMELQPVASLCEHVEDDLSEAAASAPTPCVAESLSSNYICGVDWGVLHRDFNEMVLAGCRPGYIAPGAKVSVAISTAIFLDALPAAALLTYDKKLLSPEQHITLVMANTSGRYPFLDPTCSDGSLQAPPTFQVGITATYKPQPACDTYYGVAPHYSDLEPFDMTPMLEDLLSGHFLSILHISLQYRLGWAGAEILHFQLRSISACSSLVIPPILATLQPYISQAEYEESCLLAPYKPILNPYIMHSTLSTGRLNLPLIAFGYLIRRLALGNRFCQVCHKGGKRDHEQQEPFMCDLSQCLHQCYSEWRGPSLEYEICSNPESVDLLVSMAYVAAHDMVLDPLPTGLNLRVARADPHTGASFMQDFDSLTYPDMCVAVRDLIACLPSIASMKAYLQSRPACDSSNVRLRDMLCYIPAASWTVLRWCVLSCRVKIEEVCNAEERVRNIGPEWRQFRVTLASPEAEFKFQQEVRHVQMYDYNAVVYPSLYALHGSPLHNWFSILHYGLWYKTIQHGRRYGHGIYLAKDASIAMNYAKFTPSEIQWANSAYNISQCMTLTEIVNQPRQFEYEYFTHGGPMTHVAQNIFVIQRCEWVICRYLFVRSTATRVSEDFGKVQPSTDEPSEHIPFVPIDPRHVLTLGGRAIAIPDYARKVAIDVKRWRMQYREGVYDDIDKQIFELRI